MLEFLYRLDYETREREESLPFHAKMYAIGDKYIVPALKEHARRKFKRYTTEEEMTVSELMEHGFDQAVKLVYTTPPNYRPLRNLVVKIAFKYQAILVSSESFLEAIESTPAFRRDLYLHVPENYKLDHPSLMRYNCQNHRKWWASMDGSGFSAMECIGCRTITQPETDFRYKYLFSHGSCQSSYALCLWYTKWCTVRTLFHDILWSYTTQVKTLVIVSVQYPGAM